MTIRELIESGKISLDTVVLGELRITTDGTLCGDGATVFVPCEECSVTRYVPVGPLGPWPATFRDAKGALQWLIEREATREAALSAKGASDAH